MNGANYLSAIDGLREKNRLLIIALMVMLAFNVWNWSTLRAAQEEFKVTVVPLAGGSGMWVGAGKASPEYLRAMARYITYQVGNYTAASARKQLEELLELFPPEHIGQAQIEFERLATQIERYPSISSKILWAGREPLKYDDQIIQVQVTKNRLVNGNTSESHNSFYCLSYRVSETRFWLLNIIEKEGQGEDLCLHRESVDV